MRIACIGLSKVPANTANSIQTLKACHGLTLGGDVVRLWVPGKPETLNWESLKAYYGLSTPPGSKAKPIEVRWLPSRRGLHRLDLTLAALWGARRWKADVIYTWLIQAAVLGLLLGMPVVYEMHDRPTGRFGPLWLRWFARLRGQKRVLIITRALRQKVEKEFNIRFADEAVQIAPNAVELERFASLPEPHQARRTLGLPERITAVYTGHFYAGRGTDILWALAERFPQVNFVWVGGRTVDVALWQERILRAGRDNISLTGFVENQKLPLYQAAGEILLMPYERAIAGSSGGNSADICSPMKMFEYMAAGRAILSSDLPVLSEVLNADNAAFAPAEDADAWERAFADLLKDVERRNALGSQARRDVVEYTWSARQGHVLEWMRKTIGMRAGIEI